MTISHLSTRDLATRWNISQRTLDRWRWAGEGPSFLKLGGRVVYRLIDIEAFEQQQLRHVTGAGSAAPSPAVPPRPIWAQRPAKFPGATGSEAGVPPMNAGGVPDAAPGGFSPPSPRETVRRPRSGTSRSALSLCRGTR